MLCQQFELALAEVKTQQFSPLRVLYLIWAQPYMSVARNTYIANTLQLLNLNTVPDVLGTPVGASRYPVVAENAGDLAGFVSKNRLDAVLLSTEPYAFSAAHVAEMQAQLGLPVHLIDGELTSWYGSRAIQALPRLTQWRKAL